MELETRNRSVFDRIGGPKRPHFKSQTTPQICSFWLSGKCNRNHCRFLHPGLPKLQPSSSDDPRRNKFTYSLKNDASEFGVNEVTKNPKRVLIADGKSSPVVKSKDEVMNASVVPSSVTEHKTGRIITLKKRSASPKADENSLNHKKVLTLQRSSPVVLQSKNVTAPSSNIALKSEAKSAVEKVLADERIGPVVQSKSAKVPSSNRATDSGVKRASENVLTSEKPGLAALTKNVTVPSSNSATECEVQSAMGKVLINKRSRPVVHHQSIKVTATSSNIATNSEVKSAGDKELASDRPCPVVQSKIASATDSGVKSASKEELEFAVQSKNVTVSSSNTIKKSEVKSETPDPVVQNNNLPVSSSNGGTKYEVKSDPANQTTVATTTESCSALESFQNTGLTLCQDWVVGNCCQGDDCWDVHSWFSGTGFSLLASLDKHQKAVTGITLPSGSDKLFSGDRDGSVCVWDCNSGQCSETLQLESEIGCMISEHPWVFIGVRNAIKAWNIEANTEFVIPGPNDLVNAMVGAGDVLFAGVEDGSIMAWKSCPESSSPIMLPTLKGHTSAVISLTVGGNRLYSGSKDNTIRVWDLKTLECIETLNAHKESVTSLAFFDRYLLSGSLDNSLKVWGTAENGNSQVIYEMKQESGILALRRINDGGNKPILLCSCEDKIVRVYDLPSFAERGRTFSNGEVHTLEIGCRGLFFSGDSTGRVFVWKLD